MGNHIISGLSQLFLDLIQGAEIGEVFACPLMLTVQFKTDRQALVSLTRSLSLYARPANLTSLAIVSSRDFPTA